MCRSPKKLHKIKSQDFYLPPPHLLCLQPDTAPIPSAVSWLKDFNTFTEGGGGNKDIHPLLPAPNSLCRVLERLTLSLYPALSTVPVH